MVLSKMDKSKMVEKYLPYIYKHAIEKYAYLKEKYEIEDLVQDTIFNVLNSDSDFITEGQFLGYTKLTMMNLVRNKSNRRKIKSNIDNNKINTVKNYCHILITPNGESSIIEKELQSKINSLPSSQSEIFNLFIQGFSYKDIAEKLNVKVNEIESSMIKARTKLKKICREYKVG